MDEDSLAVIGMALVLVLLIGIVLGVAYLYDKHVCDVQTEQIGFNHYYSLFGGCMIEPKPGQWMPLGNYRLFEQ